MKTIHIIDPTPEILVMQVQKVAELSALLPHATVEAIGSMAVPICGKNEIDIMVILDEGMVPDSEISAVSSASNILVSSGYRQGPIEKGISYLNMHVGETEVAIQVIPAGNTMIEIHRAILAKLQSDQSLRDRYAAFKRTLDGLSREEYKTRKSEWVRVNLL